MHNGYCIVTNAILPAVGTFRSGVAQRLSGPGAD